MMLGQMATLTGKRNVMFSIVCYKNEFIIFKGEEIHFVNEFMSVLFPSKNILNDGKGIKNDIVNPQSEEHNT